MDELAAAALVDFPLRGEWIAVTERDGGWRRVFAVVPRRQDRIRSEVSRDPAPSPP